MSYMRLPYYVYSDGAKINIHGPDIDGAIPISYFDMLAVMRYAQLVKEGRVEEVEKTAIEESYGNFGCDEVAKKHGLRSSMEAVIEDSHE